MRKKAISSVDFEVAFHVNRKQLKNGQKIYIYLKVRVFANPHTCIEKS